MTEPMRTRASFPLVIVVTSLVWLARASQPAGFPYSLPDEKPNRPLSVRWNDSTAITSRPRPSRTNCIRRSNSLRSKGRITTMVTARSPHAIRPRSFASTASTTSGTRTARPARRREALPWEAIQFPPPTGIWRRSGTPTARTVSHGMNGTWPFHVPLRVPGTSGDRHGPASGLTAH